MRHDGRLRHHSQERQRKTYTSYLLPRRIAKEARCAIAHANLTVVRDRNRPIASLCNTGEISHNSAACRDLEAQASLSVALFCSGSCGEADGISKALALRRKRDARYGKSSRVINQGSRLSAFAWARSHAACDVLA